MVGAEVSSSKNQQVAAPLGKSTALEGEECRHWVLRSEFVWRPRDVKGRERERSEIRK